MRKTRSLTPALAAAFILVVVGVLTTLGSYATFAAGPNDPATECLVQLQGSDETALADTVTCTDSDACDADGQKNGSCTIRVRACVNVGGVSGCTPQALKKVKVNPKKFGVSVTPNGSSSVCGAFSQQVVLKLRKNGTKVSKPRKLVANAKAEAKGMKDVDKVKVQCTPCATASCAPPTTTTIQAVTTTSTSTSTTTTTLACGNGILDQGETCDTNAEPNGCTVGTPSCDNCTQCKAVCAGLVFQVGPPAPGCGFPGVGDDALGSCSVTTAMVCASTADCPLGETCTGLTGEIRDGTGAKVPHGDLAAGCLYIGGGLATIVPPGPTPEGSETVFDMTDCSANNRTLVASADDNDRSCSLGPKATSKCLNGHPGTNTQGLCTSDADCAPLCINRTCSGGGNNGAACTAPANCPGGQCLGDCVNGPGNLAGGKCGDDTNCGLGVTAQTCQREARCFFGAPLPFVNDPTSTCVINVFQNGAGGTSDLNAGAVSVNVPLQSRVYLTGITYGLETPCPKCVAGACSGGKRATLACTTVNSLLTTHDCPPDDNLFLAPLTVNLSPLTTGTASKTGTNGLFCPPDQDDNPPGSAGAFGVNAARTILENGSPTPGPLTTTPQNMTLASTFCIPSADGGGLIDSAANLPGPGATALSGQTRLR